MIGVFLLSDQVFWFNFMLYWAFTVVRVLIDPYLPEDWFDPMRPIFRTHDWEEHGRVYRRLNIDRWKDRLPSFTRRGALLKKRLMTSDPDYLNRFVVETCRAESHHVRAVLSVVVMKLWTPLPSWLAMFAIALTGNLPFILIQRYNRPRLQRALEAARRRAGGELYGAGWQPNPA